ncbi:MAG: 2-hydroxyacid dehydrogenase [Acidimicrobiia bacterium]|nr:2-hydroxyacid dehydrogenase [Acidimicrobiia bacterium]
MRIAVYSTKPYDREFLANAASETNLELDYFEARLTPSTAALADGYDAVCAFVNDDLGAAVLLRLADAGVKLIALRSAGFNHVDLDAAARLGLPVVRVPAYSPQSVAEHTVALMLALDRKIHRAHSRVREGNFALDGLLGFDIGSRTVGIVGTGKIGVAVATILRGFGCRLIGYDVAENPEAVALGVEYVSLRELWEQADIISLHAPLTPDTHHLVDAFAVATMRDGVMLINTSRGALIDTAAAIEGLKTGKIGHLGLDVYEEESDLFFEDLSDTVIQDDMFSRLLTFPNVLITGHQAFFTVEALQAIANTTIENIVAFADGRASGNEL